VTQEKQGLDRLARIISEISIPPFMAAIVFPILYFYAESEVIRAITGTFVCWIYVVILPVLYVVHLEKVKQVSHRHIPIKEQRTRPFLVAVVSYIVGLIILLVLKAPFVVWGLLVCYITNTLVITAINLYWKISAHALGVAGALAGAHYAFGIIVLPLYLIIPIVCWARFRLHAHTLSQLLAGSILGLGLTFVQLFVLAYLFGLS